MAWIFQGNPRKFEIDEYVDVTLLASLVPRDRPEHREIAYSELRSCHRQHLAKAIEHVIAGHARRLVHPARLG